MVIREIGPLLSDMGKQGIKQEKIHFNYNNVRFEVIILLDQRPFELLFGLVGHNYSFILKMEDGYVLEKISDKVFYKLCDILKLKPAKGIFTSFEFLRYFASKIPVKCSRKKIEPHEIAIYKKNNIPDSEKIYFFGWGLHTRDGRDARNFDKTKELLGVATYEFCKLHNISSCWTPNITKRKDYFPPPGMI